MAGKTTGKKPRAGRSRVSRKRRGRNVGLWILGAIVLAAAFYYIDQGSTEDTLDGVVVDLGTYSHSTNSGRHTHTEAVVECEGRRYKVRPADNLSLGDPVAVTIRRGRLTGYPYFERASRR